ncbi:MAG: hypothetical protein Q8P57_01910 [Candidatus Pacearchaeota archaeon]|nr:hypothetical protein [Candidatus Pacearchaeota archaeon]
MKKITLILFLSILLAYLISGQTSEPNQPDINLNKSLEDISNNILITKTNEFLKKEITIPQKIKPITKWVLKSENNIEINKLIILFLFCLSAFIISGLLLRLTKPFKGASAWLGGLAVVIILGITSTLGIISDGIIKLSDLINPFKEIKLISLIIVLLIFIILIFFASKLTKPIRKKEDLTEAEKQGEEIGKEIGFTKKMREAYKITSEI